MPEDITNLIEDSITDAEMPLDTLPESPETSEEAPVEAVETSQTPTEEAPAEVASPAEKTEEPSKEVDDFEKKYGIPAQSASGRENRIPYTRVKKIAQNAVKDAQTEWTKGLEKTHVPVQKYQEVETKVKDYETRLGQVAQFENVMVNDAPRFMEMLARIPAYQTFFNNVRALQERLQAYEQGQQPEQLQSQSDLGDMPQPDQKLSDGSMVYSLDGLKQLLAWNAKQVESRVSQQIESKVAQRYAPIEESWNSYQKVQSVIPIVQKQIEEARTWPLFNESEADITKALQDDQNLSLEAAYRKVVLPKIQAQRDQMRADLMKELRQAPRATSAPARPQRSLSTSESAGPRTLEDVIADAIKGRG